MMNDSELLRDLLAVIHRDGGHYAHEHGVVDACIAAKRIVAGYMSAAEHDHRDADLPRASAPVPGPPLPVRDLRGTYNARTGVVSFGYTPQPGRGPYTLLVGKSGDRPADFLVTDEKNDGDGHLTVIQSLACERQYQLLDGFGTRSNVFTLRTPFRSSDGSGQS